jgi:hypothetical protein
MGKIATSVLLGLLFFAQAVRAEIPESARKKLEENCGKGMAESCASLGSTVYEKDKAKGAEWFRKACDLGKESSCVFYDSAHPRPAVPAKAPAAPAPARGNDQLVAWVQTNVSDLLLALYPVPGSSNPDHFSLDHCRIPDARLVELVLKLRKVYNHKFAFGPGCDAQGSLDVQLNKITELDLRVRKISGVERLTGRALFVVSKDSADGGLVQTTNISDAVAYDAKGGVFARFEILHHRKIGMNPAAFSVTTTDNKGKAHVTEFLGKPTQYEKIFDLDHIDR